MRIISIFLLIIAISSCHVVVKPIPRSEIYPYDVEIFCPENGRRILVETTNRQEVIESIQKFIHQKQSQGTSENYTVLRFSDKSSLMIKNAPPEQLINCRIRDVKPAIVKTYYKH